MAIIMMISTYQCLAFAFFFSFLCFFVVFSHASSLRVKITYGNFIREREGEILVSDGFNFVMNFFALDNSSSHYVGIWYYNIPGPAMIWIANRGKPLKDTGGAMLSL
ncbi:hypothetical protein SESBI_31156 [Sesbania bispinosa]|nr:hypothetical protein SESBI_31156 [Sesbania bispinosa]